MESIGSGISLKKHFEIWDLIAPRKWDSPKLGTGCGTARPDFLYSLVYDNFFQRSNVGVRNKNKMSQIKDIT